MIQKETSLNERACQVLADVVDVYGSTGQPVGSKVLVESGRQNLSPASIRNVMRDLENMGMLTHPHTSAGRMPTEAGYKFYAQNIVQAEDVDEDIKKALQAQIVPGKDVSLMIKDVSHVLQEITNCASLVTAPKLEADPLEQVEFIRLSGDQVLVVMVTKAGEIENRVIQVPAFVDTEELNKASGQLKNIVAGQTLDEARAAMIANLAEQKGRVNEMIDQMMDAANQWAQPVISDGAMVVAGSTNLFQYPELVRDKLQGLVKMFEEKRLLMALMDEVRTGAGVQIFVGSDCKFDAVEDCSVIARTYSSADKKIMGTLGVIGPMRMDYKKTIGVVDYTSRLLSTLLNEQRT